MKPAPILFAVLSPLLILAGCGKAAPLRPAPGQSLPVAPYGAATPPASDGLLTPSPEARPERQDELLRRSEKRQSDPFDLPPE